MSQQASEIAKLKECEAELNRLKQATQVGFDAHDVHASMPAPSSAFGDYESQDPVNIPDMPED